MKKEYNNIEEIFRIFCKHNQERNVRNQFQDHSRLTAYVVFAQSNFKAPYSELERTYEFTSDNKAFIDEMCGNSIFAKCVGDDDFIRLDNYLGCWKIEKTYMEE